MAPVNLKYTRFSGPGLKTSLGIQEGLPVQ